MFLPARPLPLFLPKGELAGAAILLCLFYMLLLAMVESAAAQESSCPDSSIVLGMSTALSGPAASLGTNMQAGVLAAFHAANSSGGVQGRKLCLVTHDDGYEPDRTGPNILDLIEKHKAVSIIGNVGTPTAVVTIPIVNRLHVPFFGAFTGAGILRKTPPDRYVVNYRASYAEETAAMVNALIDKVGLKVEEIAFFTQRDAYGDAGFAGGVAALKKHGLISENKVAHGRYERNSLAVENALADILMTETSPRAVIMVGTYAPCAKFIRLARKNGCNCLFLNVSFVGTDPLQQALGRDGDGVIITQVVPHIDSPLPIVMEFKKALQAWKPEVKPTFGALEGYIAARIFLLSLQKISGTPDREAIINALEQLGRFDLGLGAPLLLDKSQHQASHSVWPTVIRGAKVIPLNWKELAQP